MAFRLPLQAVLHLRQSIEHQQELRLRAANQQVARVRRRLEQLDERIKLDQNRSARALMAGTTSAELRFTQIAETSLLAHREELKQELARVQFLRDQQQQVFQKARRECETLEVLREQQLLQYQKEQARREQRELDEAFLSQMSYRRRG